MPPPPHCILGPPMTTGANDVLVFRIVHQDTGKPAPGVPVTVLGRAGNAEGHWVSDADGTVAIPRRETLKLRLRVGLRNEDPIELATATLGEGPTPLAAPTQLPSTFGVAGERPAREPLTLSPRSPASQGAAPPQGTVPPRADEQVEVPGHVLYLQRLALFAPPATPTERRPAAPGGAVADFFTPGGDGPATMRYGALIEVEQYWQ